MRIAVIFRLNIAPQAEIEFIESRHFLQIQSVDQMSAQSSPHPFDLALCRGVTGTAVHNVDADLGAKNAQVMAGEAFVIVQEQPARNAAPSDRVVQDTKKTMFRLSETGFH
jgi:hypothetical protein